ncbi:MAG TPA: substrate-binding domain-containing protein, partial [Gemmatirosa sp.]
MRETHVAAFALAATLGGAKPGTPAVSAPPPAPLLVFAAADLREALPEVVAAYRQTGGDSVTLVFGATSDLATQIANGAPADAFFAADEAAVAGLASREMVVGATVRVYAVGRL